MGEELEKKPATRRHLVKKVWMIFDLNEIKDSAGNVVGTSVGDHDFCYDADEMMDKLMNNDFMKTHKVVVLDTDRFYK